jgi:hypothetical protein
MSRELHPFRTTHLHPIAVGALGGLLLAAVPVGAICYGPPFAGCPDNNGSKAVLIPSTAFAATESAQPMDSSMHDGTGWRYFPLHGGEIRTWNGGTSLEPTAFIDLSAKVKCCGEQGLLSLAFHPNYATNGYFYVKYVGEGDAPSDDGDIVIERYTRSSNDPPVADPSSALTLLVIDHEEGSNHGDVAWSDGLYISTGDMERVRQQRQDGQNWASLRGKPCDSTSIARSSTAPSAINCVTVRAHKIPLTTHSRRDRGLWRGLALACAIVPLHFDRANGDIFIGDVGRGTARSTDPGRHRAADELRLGLPRGLRHSTPASRTARSARRVRRRRARRASTRPRAD